MRRALALAERGRGRTHPNPIVGAVIVSGGRVVGEGFHRAPGEPHAEVVALQRAGAKARGATVYVTLEPCAHHGRTPPCTDALIAAGVRRVVVATRDPHTIVDGRGLRALRRARIRVEVGLLEHEVRGALAGYWRAMTLGLPRVTWKIATTLDGKIADAAGRSRWITGPSARRLVHRCRAQSDAVVIGSGTARADDPRLTARGLGRDVPQPLRVVCDTRLSLPPRLRLFRTPLARGTVVACGPRASRARELRLRARGVEVWRLPTAGGGVSPRALARALVRAGVHDVLLECGPGLGTSWLRAGLVDRLLVFVAPCVMGAEGLPWCGPLGRRRLSHALRGRSAVWMEGEDAGILVEELH